MFKEEVYKIGKQIPKGKIITYKKIAKKINKPRAYRAVGNILNKNFNKEVPCHRVIRSDGFVGGYNKGLKKKIKLLRQEGIEIKKNKIDVDKFFV